MPFVIDTGKGSLIRHRKCNPHNCYYRSVDENSRSFALGLQNVLCRILGEFIIYLLFQKGTFNVSTHFQTRSILLTPHNNRALLLSAFIPAPIYFGEVFDSQCLLWSASCDGSGSCLEYNTKKLPFVLFGTCLGLKLLTFLFVTLAYYSAKNKKLTDGSDFGATTYDKAEESHLTEPTEPITASITVSTIYDSKISLNETVA